MNQPLKRYEAEWAGRPLIIEVGKYAPQANASATVQYGDTVILATAVMGDKIREEIDYFPLLVDYEERLYAAGKIKGSRFIKREGRPTDEAVLTTRLIDRSIRPLFRDTIRNDVQVVITALSWDGENDPALIGLLGASVVLGISDIPWNGPIAAGSVGFLDGSWKVNPTSLEREKASAYLFLSGSEEKVVMIEAGSKQVSEENMYAGVEKALAELRAPLLLIKKIIAELGVPKRDASEQPSAEASLWQEKVRTKTETFLKEKKFHELFPTSSKEDLNNKMDSLTKDLATMFSLDPEINDEEAKWGMSLLNPYFEHFAEELILKHGRRTDGRKFDEVRPLSAEVELLPRTHGSGLFGRGETQVLSVVTLGAPGDKQILDSMEEADTKKRFMHHYNFPGFCVGEVKPMRSPGRREIGHGALAEKALEGVLPSEEKFPYTIRLVSEVLSSNGSSSQASICGSSLALMDAGVPIDGHVAGIAMGIVIDKDAGRYQLLTDIAGIEDHAGHMDFKVAGSRKGITAIQLDIKTDGLTLPMVKDALEGARAAREQILDVMEKAIETPRKELSPYAPRIITLQISTDKIKDVIGPGGKMIHEIIDKTGVEIDIEQDGRVFITATAKDDVKRAVEWIEEITHEARVGEIYDGEVVNLLDFGAIVAFPPKHDGLLHISEIKPERVERIDDVLKVGDKVRVKIISAENGKIGLSIKQLDPNYQPVPRSAPHRGNNNHRSNFRGR